MEKRANDVRVSIRQRMRTPRAAAIAGIVFSCLLITSLLLIRLSIPASPSGPVSHVIQHVKAISFAFNLLPFAGVAFLWFIGVLRARLGEREDRFFATVFLGSGLLFAAMMFSAATTAGAVIRLLGTGAESPMQTGAYLLARAEIRLMNIYAMKMAGVFMIITSTISLKTSIAPRWMAFLGYGSAILLLLSVANTPWMSLVFPLWVLLVSVYVLIQNLRGQAEAPPATGAEPASLQAPAPINKPTDRAAAKTA